MAASLPIRADPLRVATFNTELGRDGPGLLLRDIARGDDPQIAAAAQVIAHIDADIILLQGIDYDLDALALNAFADIVARAGAPYPVRFALRPNRGIQTGLDMDGDGLTGGPGDAQGFGDFSGAGGMAILSRLPAQMNGVKDYSDVLWRGLPDALLPTIDGTAFPSAEAQALQRLSSSGHWVVPFTLPDGQSLTILAFHAAPPVFDGPEDRNGRRNHDEIKFWQHYLEGAFGLPATARFVLMGDANLDPLDSDGRHIAMRGLLNDPRFQDPQPAGAGGRMLANADHAGDPALDTADWDDPDPGNLRVDYVLPSSDWTVFDAGVFWPLPSHALAQSVATASRHRIVWVDLSLD